MSSSSSSSHAQERKKGRPPRNRYWPLLESPTIRFPSLSSSPEPRELSEPADPTGPDESSEPAGPVEPSGTEASTRKKEPRKVVSIKDKYKICNMHKDYPEMRQRDLAARFRCHRTTIAKILKEKDRWQDPINRDKPPQFTRCSR